MEDSEDIQGEEHDPIDVEPDLILPVVFQSEFGSHEHNENCPAEGKGWCPCQQYGEAGHISAPNL